jgi:RNA methyltransferase, TrmH family
MRNQNSFDQRLRRVEGRHNASIKELRRLFREAIPNQQGEVAVEGMHLVEEAIRSGLRISTVFFSDSAHQRAHKLLPQLSAHSDALLLPDDLFASAVPTETPQGVAALVKVKSYALDDLLGATPALLLVTVGVQDPGNLGTIARSGEAFGATGLLLGEGTVSPWNWKATRASAGSLFRLPAAKLPLTEVLNELRSRGVRLLATSSHKGTPVWDADLRGSVAILIGSEGAGVPRNMLAQADELIAIPQSETVESLNAGIAASVVLYEAARQRQNDGTV